jgi:flagellar protein FliO/FliZ
MKKIGPRARSTGIVQVVGGASVGPREKVVVVRFGQQTLLLGVAPGQVSLLHTADASELADEAVGQPSAPRFIDRLRAARSKE